MNINKRTRKDGKRLAVVFNTVQGQFHILFVLHEKKNIIYNTLNTTGEVNMTSWVIMDSNSGSGNPDKSGAQW